MRDRQSNFLCPRRRSVSLPSSQARWVAWQTTRATRGATCASGYSPPRPTSAPTSDTFTWGRPNIAESRVYPVRTVIKCSRERWLQSDYKSLANCAVNNNLPLLFPLRVAGQTELMLCLLQGHMTEHVRTVHEGKKRIYKEVNCQVTLFTPLW